MLRSPFLLLLLVAFISVVNANVPLDDFAVDVVEEDEVFQEEVVEAHTEVKEEEEEEGGSRLETDREAILFQVQQRQSGFTYMDKYEMQMVQHISMAGMDIATTTEMQMDSETLVQDLPEGGQSLDTTFTHMAMTMDAGMMKVKCDTDGEQSDEGEDEEGDMMSGLDCAPINAFKDVSLHFVIDDEGNVVVTDVEGAVGDDEEVDEDGPDFSLGSKQVDQTSRLLKLVPNDVPIKPGDEWDASEDLGDMGKFTAKGQLQGYINFNDIDCAVISLSGSLEMDMKKAMEMMGSVDIPGVGDITVEDATMDTQIYYDHETMLIRWSQATINMVIKMPNPMAPHAPPITAPTTEVVTTTTEIKSEN